MRPDTQICSRFLSKFRQIRDYSFCIQSNPDKFRQIQTNSGLESDRYMENGEKKEKNGYAGDQHLRRWPARLLTYVPKYMPLPLFPPRPASSMQ